MEVQGFKRRYYRSLQQYWQDFFYLLVRPWQIHRAMNHTLTHAFRERLMIVVTEVNQCSYCRTFHRALASFSGVGDLELEHFIEGQISPQTPREELAALEYARQWAEDNAEIDNETHNELVNIYGTETAAAIDLALRLIWIGNLSGNTWDYWLYRLSSGRLGQ